MRNNFTPFSNPDFSKSLIVEGSGGRYDDNNEFFHLSPAQDFGSPATNDAMHLVGGAAKQPFVAYFSRQILNNPAMLPAKLFSSGRLYTPVNCSNQQCLTSTQQSTAIQMFCVCANEDMMNDQAESIKAIMTEVLVKFGELRLVERGLDSLERGEVNRTSFQLFLPASRQFIEVGYLSIEKDYLSRRVMFKQRTDNGQYANLWTCGGQLVNVTRLLAVILENEQIPRSNQCGANKDSLLVNLQYLTDVVEFQLQDFHSPEPNSRCSH